MSNNIRNDSEVADSKLSFERLMKETSDITVVYVAENDNHKLCAGRRLSDVSLCENGTKVASYLEVKCHKVCTDNDLGDCAVAVNRKSSSVTGTLVSSDGFHKKQNVNHPKDVKILMLKLLKKLNKSKSRQ